MNIFEMTATRELEDIKKQLEHSIDTCEDALLGQALKSLLKKVEIEIDKRG